jgi:hypothetical protein
MQLRPVLNYSLSLICLLLALLFKEMALGIPGVLIALHYFHYRRLDRRLGILALACAALLLAYAYARWSLLGNIGGYDAHTELGRRTLWSLANPVRAFAYPLNVLVLEDSTSFLRVLVHFGLASAYLAAIYSARNQQLATHAGFLVVVVASLLPLLNIGAVTDGLEGSRVYYLPSVAVSMWFAVVYCPERHTTSVKTGVATAGLICFLLTSATLERVNSANWRDAGRLTRKIIAALEQLPEGPKKLYRLPDNLRGAHVFRNGINAAQILVNGRTEQLCWSRRARGAVRGVCPARAPSYRWNQRSFVPVRLRN